MHQQMHHGKTSGRAKPVTPSRMANQLAHKSQPLPTFTTIQGEEPSESNSTDNHPVDTEANLNAVMDMLVDISSYLAATEHIGDDVRDDKAAEAAQRVWSPLPTRTTPGTSSGYTCRCHALVEPQQAAAAAMADVSDAVRPKVASQMRSFPVMDLVTSDEEFRSEKNSPLPPGRGD